MKRLKRSGEHVLMDAVAYFGAPRRCSACLSKCGKCGARHECDCTVGPVQRIKLAYSLYVLNGGRLQNGSKRPS